VLPTMTAKPTLNPPFRAEHIGSLKRPASLLEKRAAFNKGAASPQELAKAEDAAIKDIVDLQRRVGIKAVTDGEFR
jgi:methionine synthase II (cobalamin-independent)